MFLYGFTAAKVRIFSDIAKFFGSFLRAFFGGGPPMQ